MSDHQKRHQRPQLIVIGGHSGSGKTTLARGLAQLLGLPLLSKDSIKEALFDSLGWSDRAWSQRLGAAAIAVLYRQLEQLLASGKSCIVESIFRADLDGPRLGALCAQHGVQPVELQCVAPGELLVARVRARIVTGERHPGHVDDSWLEEHEQRLRSGPLPLLHLGGPVRTVDTSETAIDSQLPAVAAWVVASRLPALGEQVQAPTVLLLRGSSGVGKTRLAAQLAQRLGIGWLSADDLRLALQRATRGSALPALHAFFDELPTMPAEAIATSYRAVAEIVSHALEIVVAHHVATALPVVIEGDTILPAMAAQRRFAELPAGGQVRALFLVESDADALRWNTLARGRGAEAMSAAELETHVAFSGRHGQWLAAEAAVHGLPVLAPRPFATLLERALDALGIAAVEP